MIASVFMTEKNDSKKHSVEFRQTLTRVFSLKINKIKNLLILIGSKFSIGKPSSLFGMTRPLCIFPLDLNTIHMKSISQFLFNLFGPATQNRSKLLGINIDRSILQSRVNWNIKETLLSISIRLSFDSILRPKLRINFLLPKSSLLVLHNFIKNQSWVYFLCHIIKMGNCTG